MKDQVSLVEINPNEVVFGGTRLTSQDFDANKEQLTQWLSQKANIKKVQKAYKMNQPITFFEVTSKNDRIDVGGFKFMGKDYTSKDSYNDYLMDSKTVSHNKYTENGALFVGPPIALSSEVEAVETYARTGVGTKPESTNSNMPDSEYSDSEGLTGRPKVSYR